MWWQHRRGRQAACCPAPRRSSDDNEAADVDSLRQRQANLAVQVAELRSAREDRAARPVTGD
jgi:hypothetical protein